MDHLFRHAQSNTQKYTNSSAAPSSLKVGYFSSICQYPHCSFPQTSATSLEITPERELTLDKDGESAEDDEILDVSAVLVRIPGMKSNADRSPAIYSNS